MIGRCPRNVRKAEIDTRDGSLIRELDQAEALNTRDDVNKANRKPDPDPSGQTDDETAPSPDDIAPNVPVEFRRVELFVSGTVPTKKLPAEEQIEYDPDTGEPIIKETPTPKPTPVDGTWQDNVEPPGDANDETNTNGARKGMVSLLICPLTGMRATSNCPNAERRSFRRGTEPKDFCTFHVNPPK